MGFRPAGMSLLPERRREPSSRSELDIRMNVRKEVIMYNQFDLYQLVAQMALPKAKGGGPS